MLYYSCPKGQKGENISIGLGTILGVVFLILKLVGVIAWPWIWVLAPFWIGIALFLIVFIITLLFAGIISKL